MKRKDFFESPEGQRHLLRKRRLRRLHFTWALQPKGYGKIKRDKEKFLNHLINEMTKRGRRYYRSDLALSIDLVVTSNTPPSIEKIPKGYIDLLHRRYHENNPSSLSKSEKMRLLMNDDAQIKYLSVNFHVSEDSPRLRFKVDRFKSLIDDLELLNSLDSEQLFDDQEDYHNFDYDFHPEKYHNVLGEKAIIAMKYMNESDKQGYGLDVINFKFRMFETLLSGYAQNEYLEGRMIALYQILRDQILSFPGCIALGHPPLTTGESDQFKHRIAMTVNTSLNDFGITKPILHTLSCTIVIIQPDKNVYGENLKDIDNYAFHHILPVIYQELKPHTTLGSIFYEHYPLAEEYKGHHKSQKGLPRSVLQYNVLEIPRLDSDPEKGAVFMFIGKADSRSCYWKELDQKIDSCIHS